MTTNDISYLADFNQDRLADVVHRGRDHGLPTYSQIRELCGLTPANNFDELNTTIDPHVIANLRRTYQVGKNYNLSRRIPRKKMFIFSMHSMSRT